MKQFSLMYQVLIAILLGIAAGLFFGPLCSFIKPVGDIFIMLLQMMALPYICFSIVHGLGSISPPIAKKLFKKGGIFLLTIWVLTFIIIYLLNILIPRPVYTFIGKMKGETIFSENFLTFVVPENPFYDLVNNVVPAIAIFSLILGAAVMTIQVKEPLLGLLERANNAIETIFIWLAHVAPIAIFAHIAYAVGTVDFKDLFKLEFYVITFILVTLFITFVILPLLLNTMTSMKYKEVIMCFRKVCLLAFATGVPSIAFPFIIRTMRKLAEKNQLEMSKFHSTSQTIIPLGYSFAQVGNCFVLFFIFFLSFYFRHPFVLTEKVLLSLLTIPLSFGAAPLPINGINFLIQQLNFPHQAIELFNETMAITIHFQVLLSVASVLTFIILVLFSYYGLLQVRWKALLTRLILSLAALTVMIFIVKVSIKLTDGYENFYAKLRIQDILDNPVTANIHDSRAEWDQYKKDHPVSTNPGPSNITMKDYFLERPYILHKVLTSGVLKIGYDTTNIPYCYYNERNEVVGYDIAYAYQLARDLDCKLELFPMYVDEMADQLETEFYDIGMSAVLMDERRLLVMDFSDTYAEEDNVLVIPIAKKNDFLVYENVIQNKNLRLGATGGYLSVAKKHFPYAQVIPFAETPALESGKVDALVWSRINAFVWCSGHPEYAIVTFESLLGKKYFAYPMKQGAYQIRYFLNDWLDLKNQQGFKEEQMKFWLEGINPKKVKPRWSIIRDVLHWVK